MKILTAACRHSLHRPIWGIGILLPLLLFSASILPVQRASARLPELYVGSNTPNNTTNFTTGTNQYDNAYVGYTTDAFNNLLTVGNTNTVLDLTPNGGKNIYVGYDGSGNSLVISNGGTVADNNGYIGYNSSSSNNSVLVTGTNSLWTNRGKGLFVGASGSGNSLVISNGGTVASLSSRIGSENIASNNSVLVTGAGSLWTNSGDLYVGRAGSGNSLVISDGGSVVNSNGYIGYTNTASNNSVLVTGAGSTCSGEWLLVGVYGSGNSLVISNGGSVTNVIGSIGSNAISSNNIVTVTGNGSTWLNNELVVGWEGSSNSLVISSGAKVVSSNTYLGVVSSNNSVTVTGAGSVATFGGSVFLGIDGSGNSMVVSNGGKVVSYRGSYIGLNPTSSNNSVLVTGANSLWTNSGGLIVGRDGTGNTLTVAEGGTVAESILIYIADSAGSSGTLNIGRFGTNDTAGTIISPTIAFGAGSGAINFNQTDSTTLTSSILELGTVQQLGIGTTILSGSNSYTGVTTISRGTLVAASTNALGGSDITLGGTANTATLRLATNLSINNTGPTTYDLTWGSNGVIALTPGSQMLTLAGGMTNAGGGTFNFINPVLDNSTNTLITFGSQTNFTTNSFSVQGIQGYSFELTANHVAAYIATTANIVLSTNIILNNTLTVASLTVAPSGSLSGNGTLNGNLTNGGTFTPGNAGMGTGVFTLNGNFTQTGSGAFILQASSGSQHNALQVNGSVLLGGTLVVTGVNGYALNFGDRYTFINSTGPIKGAFSSIETPAGFRGRLVIEGDPTASVIIAPASYTQLALGKNQLQVARALDSFIPATSGDRLVVSTSLDSLTASQYNQAFNAIMPTMYQSLATIAFNEANALNMELNQRLWGVRLAEGGGFSMSGFADNTAMIQEGQGDGAGRGKGVLDSKKDILRPGADNHWGMFVDANGIFANANSGNMLPGYNAESGGITAGLTYKWNDSFASGLYCGYEGTYAKMGANGSGLGTGSSLIDNAVRFGVFGTYGHKDGRGFYANTLAGGAYHNYQATRVIQYTGLDRTANSSPGAGELDTMIATGYDLQKGKFTYGPTASLQYTYLGVNGVNETGAQSLNFNSGGWNSSSMLSSVGAHAAYNWQAGKNVVVVPQLSLSWQHEFLQNPYDISGNLGGTSPTFSNTSATGIRDYLYTGVGFTVEFGKKWNTSFFYNAAAGNSDLTSQNIFWSAGVKF
jgi:T5SS/PEP-CTERM-associated repeat protein